MASMNKKERRREFLRQAETREKEEALARPRHPATDIGWRGIGPRIVQVVCKDPWEPVRCWEIRDRSGLDAKSMKYVVYYSVSQSDDSDLLTGYQQMDVPSETLKNFVRRLSTVSIPIFHRMEPVAIADGTTYEVALYGGIQSSCRLSWRGDSAPETWREIDLLTSEMVDVFKAARMTGDGA